jgi:hypothetical protein
MTTCTFSHPDLSGTSETSSDKYECITCHEDKQNVNSVVVVFKDGCKSDAWLCTTCEAKHRIDIDRELPVFRSQSWSGHFHFYPSLLGSI